MVEKLLYDTDDGSVEYLVTGGEPQRSILGPLLWNMMYKHLLRIKVPRHDTLIDCAVDIAIVILDKNLKDTVWACETVVTLIKEWLVSDRLNLAEH